MGLPTSMYMFHNDHGFFYIFRCLFLPSLATVKGVSADNIPTGGIGGGEKWCFVPPLDQHSFEFQNSTQTQSVTWILSKFNQDFKQSEISLSFLGLSMSSETCQPNWKAQWSPLLCLLLRLPRFSSLCWSVFLLLVSDQQIQLSLWLPPGAFADSGAPHVPCWAALQLPVSQHLLLWWLPGNHHWGGGLPVLRW